MKRSRWMGAWFDLARTSTRASRRLNKAIGKATARHAPAVRKAAKWVASGVATPAPAPSVRSGGRWEEGRWGLGPLAMRRYRLFLPAGIRRPVPLLVLLHGCGQDAASFAASTRAATIARAAGFAVLMPEQSSEANAQRCWNWFRPEPVVAVEAGILKAIVEHVCNLHPLRHDRVFALGLSAGGAMAMTLALRYPELLAGVGAHSGAVPHSAATVLQAGQAMRGRRSPALASLRRRLAGRRLPPLIVIHGDVDRSVDFANADASVALWRELLSDDAVVAGRPRTAARGTRFPYTVVDWARERRVFVRQVSIAGLGHAWSGGAARQAFSDPRGPDALKLAWRFFSQCVDRA